MPPAAISFTLPPDRNAPAPPERQGLRRDQVRLLVLDRETGAVIHTDFRTIGRFLRPGDLLVLNNSRTLPAALAARTADGRRWEVRLHRRLAEDTWEALVLPREEGPPAEGSPGREPGQGAAARTGPALAPGKGLWFGEGLEAAVAVPPPAAGPPLAVLRFSRSGRGLTEALYRLGQPVRYEYVSRPWPLEDYQTVYACQPGSVEMPSAGRPFTWELLFRLRRQGVGLAFLTLHTGLSDYGAPRWVPDPAANPEAFAIPPETAAAVNAARAAGRRVIAVGTTVVRALEHAGRHGGPLAPGAGWADLRVGPGYRLQVVDGLLTGFHEPEASHLDLLSAFVPPAVLERAYAEAIARGYLWHEFGDMNLILPLGPADREALPVSGTARPASAARGLAGPGEEG